MEPQRLPDCFRTYIYALAPVYKMIRFSTVAILAVLSSFGTFTSYGQTKKTQSDLKKEEAQVASIIKKLNKRNYVGVDLQTFYSEFGDQITAPSWAGDAHEEYLKVFSGVRNSGAYFRIDFTVIPDSMRLEPKRTWTIQKLGKSKIGLIRLSASDGSTLYKSFR